MPAAAVSYGMFCGVGVVRYAEFTISWPEDVYDSNTVQTIPWRVPTRLN